MSLHFTIGAGISYCRYLLAARFVNPFRQHYLVPKPAHDYMATLHPCSREGRDALDRAWSRADSRHNTTDRALLQWELSTPWPDSSNSDAGLVQGQSALAGFPDTSWMQPSMATSLTLAVAHWAWLLAVWVGVCLPQLNIQIMGNPLDVKMS